MPRPRKHRPLSLDEQERYLNDATTPLPRLFEAIRRCNPTGLDLPPEQVRERYALKAQLQSRLLLWHEEALNAVPTRTPGTFALRPRVGRGDGCHCVARLLSPAAQQVLARLSRTPAR